MKVNDKLERACKPILWYYPNICFEELMKTMRHFIHTSQLPGQDPNSGSSKYEARCLKWLNGKDERRVTIYTEV
jgi:hypothetical protein